jgi:alpha-tubulin suppressor-like RCC1 family protein
LGAPDAGPEAGPDAGGSGVEAGGGGPPAPSIAAGNAHTCALLSRGTVECWGFNGYGALGNGTNTGPQTCGGGLIPCFTTPVAVSGLSGATAIAAGFDHNCAVVSGGAVVCWGNNALGQLGDGTSSGPQTCVWNSAPQPCSMTPVAVSGLSGVTTVAAGYYHNCAMLSGGTVACWGDNSVGELGNLTTTASSTPVPVSNLSGVKAIAAGDNFTCALLSSGTVQCWGANDVGQLGDGTYCGPPSSTCPATSLGASGVSGALAIAAGGSHACALLSGGTVKCWGSNGAGQLGDGTHCGPPSSLCPTISLGLSGLTGAVAISAGGSHACALVLGGAVKCWGSNVRGQLGDGTTVAIRVAPVAVSGLGGATAISAGNYQTCALVAGGHGECWGDNWGGELGDGTNTGPQTCAVPPVSVPCSMTPVAVSGL